jgi:hypothetical protein
MATLQTRRLLHRSTGGDTGATGVVATTTTTMPSEQPGDEYERRMRVYQGIVSGAIPDRSVRRLRGRFGLTQQPAASIPRGAPAVSPAGITVQSGSAPPIDRRRDFAAPQAIERVRQTVQLHRAAEARQQARRSTDANVGELSPWGS